MIKYQNLCETLSVYLTNNNCSMNNKNQRLILEFKLKTPKAKQLGH